MHLSYRAGWLRAAVLGANDGILSVASVVIGVAASGAGQAAVATAGVAALSAGAMSMAAGEFVLGQLPARHRKPDLALEERELAADPTGRAAVTYFSEIYIDRGLSSTGPGSSGRRSAHTITIAGSARAPRAPGLGTRSGAPGLCRPLRRPPQRSRPARSRR